MSWISGVDVDDVWEIVGRSGWYQLSQLTVLFFATLPMAFHIFSVVFQGREIESFCQLPVDVDQGGDYYNMTNVTLPSGSCKLYVGDNRTGSALEESCIYGYNYTEPRDRSYISEWNLVCDRESMGRLAQTLVMAGMFFGALCLPTLGDRFGRKVLHVGCHLLLFAVVLAMAFVPDYTTLLVLKFLTGFIHQGYTNPMTIMTLELFPTSHRSLLGFFCAIVWSISLVCVTPIAYLTRDFSWRITQIVFAAFSAFAVLEIWFLDESLRWLVANNKTEQALKIIKKAARFNGKNFDKVLKSLAEKSSDCDTLVVSEEKNATSHKDVSKTQTQPFIVKDPGSSEKLGLLDLVTNKTLRMITLIVNYTWITNSLTYYGLALLSSQLAGNIYVNFLLGALLEIPSYILLLILFKRYGRKKTCIFFHLFGGFSLVAAVLVSAIAGDTHAASICQTVFSLMGRFGISGSYAAIWLYTPEVYPTNCRILGLGLASSMARLGGMASPFLKSLANIAVWAPGAIFSVTCITVTGLILLLPETSGRELPHTIEDLERWKTEKRRKTDTKDSKTKSALKRCAV